MHEHIKDICRRLASRGYLAIAPELYAQQGDVAKMTEIDDIVSKWFPRFPMPKFSQTSTQQWPGSKSQGRAIPASWASRVFAGAGVSCGLCSTHAQVKAGVAWYGRLSGSDALQPRHPIDVAASLTVPVLGLYGADDKGIPIRPVEQMESALKQGSSGSQIVVYPDTPHGFHADYRPSYRKEQAENGWNRLLK